MLVASLPKENRISISAGAMTLYLSQTTMWKRPKNLARNREVEGDLLFRRSTFSQNTLYMAWISRCV
jgi:hypothetical protein